MASHSWKSLFVLGACAAWLLAGCGEGASTRAAKDQSVLSIEEALDHPKRPNADKEDDIIRKTSALFEFIGAAPGMTVFEIEAGRGYHTEVLSRLVGPDGRIIMHNPAPFDSFVGDAIEQRLENDRLANVRYSRSNFDVLDAEDNSVDLVTWILGPHELYFRPPGVETLGDVDAAYAEPFRILKPGGAFIILDHAAPEGASTESGGELHRIDPAVVKRLAQAAGFELVEESDLLSNPEDQYELSVFDPEVRRRTDRFLLKYRKPM
ncbi:MAG: class I SAM-dependent methyltransferase [Pseudomonadota bacterium]